MIILYTLLYLILGVIIGTLSQRIYYTKQEKKQLNSGIPNAIWKTVNDIEERKENADIALIFLVFCWPVFLLTLPWIIFFLSMEKFLNNHTIKNNCIKVIIMLRGF